MRVLPRKLEDVANLYLHPPPGALVISVDEKSLGYHRQGRLVHRHFALAFSTAQEGQRSQYGVRGRRAAKFDRLQQHRKETPHLTVMVDELVKIARFVFATAQLIHSLNIFF
jgi:hypothetical protein